MGEVKMINSLKTYELLHSNDFSERQAKAITECLESCEKNIKEQQKEYATKPDIKELKFEIDALKESIDIKFGFLDQKIDTLRGDMNMHFKHLTHWMIGSFVLIFTALGYLVFK